MLGTNNAKNGKDMFCYDLPTKPQTQAGKILVTGALGYIGGGLALELLARGYKVRVMLRGDLGGYRSPSPQLELVKADALNIDQLKAALDGIDTAYYLIHSLYLGPKEFEAVDRKAAVNFREVAEQSQINRIIYLGGLGDKGTALSPHLRNRIEVADELMRGRVPVTTLRAAIIIGPGSASYEIVEQLVKKLPFMPVPLSAKNRCQPISIRDVIKYLVGVLEVPETAGKCFDIGGRDVLTYEMMLKTLAGILKRKIIFVPSPFPSVTLFARAVGLLTPIPYSMAKCLLKGLKNEVVCQDDSIRSFLPFEPLSYKEAILEQ